MTRKLNLLALASLSLLLASPLRAQDEDARPFNGELLLKLLIAKYRALDDFSCKVTEGEAGTEAARGPTTTLSWKRLNQIRRLTQVEGAAESRVEAICDGRAAIIVRGSAPARYSEVPIDSAELPGNLGFLVRLLKDDFGKLDPKTLSGQKLTRAGQEIKRVIFTQVTPKVTSIVRYEFDADNKPVRGEIITRFTSGEVAGAKENKIVLRFSEVKFDSGLKGVDFRPLAPAGAKKVDGRPGPPTAQPLPLPKFDPPPR